MYEDNKNTGENISNIIKNVLIKTGLRLSNLRAHGHTYDIINNLDEYCKNGMASGKSTGKSIPILANMKSPLFILGLYFQ